MTREQFIEWATERGWKPDRFGHLQKSYPTNDGKQNEYRFKLSRIAVRYEVKIRFSAGSYTPAKSEWKRLRSAYFKKLTLGADGKIAGMER